MKTALYILGGLAVAAGLALGYRELVQRPPAAETANPEHPVPEAPGPAVPEVPEKPGAPEVPADLQAHIDAHADLIRLDSPSPNEAIESPLTIAGEARGSWYFEATFPVVLVNWDGLIIAEGVATAGGEWMTEEFVPFTATLEFEKPGYGERGALILQKDNPSGLPRNDALEIPIRFGPD